MTILLMALALVAWGILGHMSVSLAKKGGGQGKEKATFRLKYSDDSEIFFVDGEKVSDGAITATNDETTQRLYAIGVELDLSFFGLEVSDDPDIRSPYWVVISKKRKPAVMRYWFTATDGNFYNLDAYGTCNGDLQPESGTTTVTGTGEWYFSDTWHGDDLYWKLIVERVE
jgi:hypothetical protein